MPGRPAGAPACSTTNGRAPRDSARRTTSRTPASEVRGALGQSRKTNWSTGRSGVKRTRSWPVTSPPSLLRRNASETTGRCGSGGECERGHWAGASGVVVAVGSGGTVVGAAVLGAAGSGVAVGTDVVGAAAGRSGGPPVQATVIAQAAAANSCLR